MRLWCFGVFYRGMSHGGADQARARRLSITCIRAFGTHTVNQPVIGNVNSYRSRLLLTACHEEIMYFLTACRKGTKSSFPLQLSCAFRLEGVTLANRLAASINIPEQHPKQTQWSNSSTESVPCILIYSRPTVIVSVCLCLSMSVSVDGCLWPCMSVCLHENPACPWVLLSQDIIFKDCNPSKCMQPPMKFGTKDLSMLSMKDLSINMAVVFYNCSSTVAMIPSRSSSSSSSSSCSSCNSCSSSSSSSKSKSKSKSRSNSHSPRVHGGPQELELKDVLCGYLRCRLRLGWLSQVNVYLKSRLYIPVPQFLKWTYTWFSQPSLSQHRNSHYE